MATVGNIKGVGIERKRILRGRCPREQWRCAGRTVGRAPEQCKTKHDTVLGNGGERPGCSSHGSAFPEDSVAQRQRWPVIVDQLWSAVRIGATLLWRVLPHVPERVQLQHDKQPHVITVPAENQRDKSGRPFAEP